jgi:dihydrofolate reductase
VTAAPRLALIAAVAENGVIGADGKMPWKLSTDLKRFKQLTLGKPVIMGRRTWASLGKPLVDRLNIVVTHDRRFSADGAVVAHSLDEAVALANDWARGQGGDEVMVIGGGEIYRQAIGKADRLYLTHVEAAPAGDAHFPEVPTTVWQATSRESHPAGDKDTAPTRFVVYDRR